MQQVKIFLYLFLLQKLHGFLEARQLLQRSFLIKIFILAPKLLLLFACLKNLIDDSFGGTEKILGL